MTRNLKVLGLALVALGAISALGASGASAQVHKGWLTSDGPVTLTGTDTVGKKSKFSSSDFPGQAVMAHGHYHIGTVGDPNSFDEFLDMWDEVKKVSETTITKLTVKPTYTDCEAENGESTLPCTVTMNECDFVLAVGETLEPGLYAVTADIVCPEGKQIEVHTYTNSEHKTSVCTLTIPAQTGKTGGTAKTIEEGGVHKITLQGPFKGIKATRDGILCGGTKTTEKAEQEVHAILSGFNEAGQPTGITVTDTE